VNARGFTLLEVLVALAILGVAVVASIQGFAQGLRLLKLAGDHQDAMLIADQKIREVVTFEEGREEGTDTRFRWRRTIARVPMPELAGLTRPNDWALYRIDVHVSWDERREIHLATQRMVANTPVIETVAPPTGQPQTGTPGPTLPGATPPGTTTPGAPSTGTPRPGTQRPGPQSGTPRSGLPGR
jgi:type II secretion system protein I